MSDKQEAVAEYIRDNIGGIGDSVDDVVSYIAEKVGEAREIWQQAEASLNDDFCSDEDCEGRICEECGKCIRCEGHEHGCREGAEDQDTHAYHEEQKFARSEME